MNANFAERLAELPQYLSAHVVLSMCALLAGIVLSIPLGIQAARRPRLAAATLNAASVIQTIPGLALLALMVPLLGGRIGFLPAFIALMLYSVLPILRNTIVGLQGIEPQIREAARGIGLTDRQRLWQIELPLALPVLLAGLRIVLVQTIGLAVVAALIGAGGLGAFVFQGLGQTATDLVLLGALTAIALALAADVVLRAASAWLATRLTGARTS